MKNLLKSLHKFKADEDGTMSIELVLVVPLLVWALLSTFVYFDVFRVEANSNRASLTLAEMFSRETTPITSEFLNSAREVLRTLTFEESSPDYRVTVYRYRPSDDSYLRVWSRHRGLDQTLRNEDLALLQAENKLPKMNSIDHAILIETRIEYDAPFSIGLSPFTGTSLDDVTFTTFTVIRPRASKLCFDSSPGDGDNTSVQCGP